jgi:hypothetical protein
MTQPDNTVISQLALLVRIYKRKLRLFALIKSLPWIAIIISTGYFIPVSLSILISLSLIIIVGQYAICIHSELYKSVTKENFLLHFNRQYPELHESSQLIFSPETELSSLQKLQKLRVLSTLKGILNSDKKLKLPTRSIQSQLILLTAVLLIILVLALVTEQWRNVVPQTPIVRETVPQPMSKSIIIESSDITIIPPGYSELPTVHQQSLTLNLLAGSKVRWQLNFSNKSSAYFLIFSDDKRVPFIQQKDLSYIFEGAIKFSQIYRIVSDEQTLNNIFTITVNQDKKPNIRILTPRRAVTSVAKNHQKDVVTRVKITDDFALSKVEILASIAKGSGESVKFRDQTFFFDSVEQLDGESIYHKNWQLQDLGMEAGDELYFTVNAWDNRQPNQQITQSTTKIIRWLEEEGEGVLSDGILIDFIPAYFKSQRQIIIDTTELIEDQKEISKTKFRENSELLGVSQSHLKERYGKYLGDEVDDGGASHIISDEAAHGIEDSASDSTSGNSEQSDDKQGHNDSEEHGNDEFEIPDFTVDKSGLSEQIARFGHSHEAGDIGIMAKQDPKALMKRSIASMWQAELHLMLSEPAKALPYEREALKYLNLAKKAERIYVKRLGFEPPPVSEERRYQGEMTDIKNYTQHQNPVISNEEQLSLMRVFTLLNSYSNSRDYGQNKVLNLVEQKDVEMVKVQFEHQLENRPALIEYVAILQRILLAKNLNLPQCATCINDLAYKIWKLIPQNVAIPVVNKKSYTNNEKLIREYGFYLRKQELEISEKEVAND